MLFYPHKIKGDKYMLNFNPLSSLLIACTVAGCSQFADAKPKASVKKLPSYRVAYVEYKGDFENNPEIYDIQLEKLLKWAVPAGLWNFPGSTELIIIYPDDPESTPKSEQRMLMAISVPADTKIPGLYKSMVIPGGYYAVGTFEISPEEFGAAWGHMYGEFIPESGYRPAEGMSFEMKKNDSDEHPQKKHIVDICIPVIKTR